MKSEANIWKDFKEGSNYALSYIYHKHIQILYRYGKKFSTDEELIKDTVQELFFDLIRSRSNLGETDNICFYLMTSFRRKLFKAINKKKHIEYSDENDFSAEIVYSAEHELINREELTHKEKIIMDALSELSPKQREILFYRYSCDFDYDQICEIMKLQYNSARKQMSRALKSLKKILENEDILVFFYLGFRKKKTKKIKGL